MQICSNWKVSISVTYPTSKYEDYVLMIENPIIFTPFFERQSGQHTHQNTTCELANIIFTTLVKTEENSYQFCSRVVIIWS